MPEGQPVIFAGGTLMPVSSPPIRDGAVLVEDGRISSVGPLSLVGSENPDAEIRFFPNYALIPGAVNAHSHLGFRRKDRPEGGTFAGWLSKLIERLPEKESWGAEAARDSAREAVEAGGRDIYGGSPHGGRAPPPPPSGGAG